MKPSSKHVTPIPTVSNALLLETTPVFQYDVKQNDIARSEEGEREKKYTYIYHRRPNVCHMETLWKEKFHVQVPGSLNETDFDSESVIPGERQLVPFARRSPWSFCYDDKAFSGGQGVVISHPPHSPDLAPPDLLPFLKVKTSLKWSWIRDTGRHQTKLH